MGEFTTRVEKFSLEGSRVMDLQSRLKTELRDPKAMSNYNPTTLSQSDRHSPRGPFSARKVTVVFHEKVTATSTDRVPAWHASRSRIMYLWEVYRGSPYVLPKHRLQRSNQHLLFRHATPIFFRSIKCLPNNLLPIDHAPPPRTRD